MGSGKPARKMSRKARLMVDGCLGRKGGGVCVEYVCCFYLSFFF